MATTDRPAAPRRVTRPSAGRAAMLVALVWGVAVVFVLAVASDTRIGPVVFKITERHGVHLGDLYDTLGCGVVAALITVWIVTDHLGRRRRWERAQRRAADRRLAAAEPADDEPGDQAGEAETVYIERDDSPGRHRIVED